MKAFVSINDVENLANRSNVGINITGKGNEFVALCNKVTALCKKHNAQENLTTKASHLERNKMGEIVGYSNGNCGGTITFHSHSCDPEIAVKELLAINN